LNTLSFLLKLKSIFQTIYVLKYRRHWC